MSKSLLLSASYGRKTAVYKKNASRMLYESLAIVTAEHSLWRKECYFICKQQCAIKRNYFAPTEITASHFLDACMSVYVCARAYFA